MFNMKPTTNIKLTKEEATLLLQIIENAMVYSDEDKAAIKRIYNKVWAEKVVIQDMER